VSGGVSRGLRALAVFGATLLVGLVSLRSDRQLGLLFGLTDEWFSLGLALRQTGTLGLDSQPSVLRPPGYPAFVAAAAWLSQPKPGPVAGVMLAQCVALALSAALLSLLASRFLRPAAATAAGLLFGINPYSIVLIGLLNYSVLHLLAVIVACLLLHVALETPDARRPMALAGAAWGLAALVRPTSLLAPPLLLLALWLWLRLSWKRAVSATLVFATAMALLIAPWTLRNHRVTGQLVPVNAQGQTALWASTVIPFGLDPNHFHWRLLYRDHFLPVYARVTGDAEYSYDAYVRHNLALEQAFGAAARANLRQQPGVYAFNVARSFVAFGAHVNSMLIDVFRVLQSGRLGFSGRAFEAYFGTLTLFAALGLGLAFARRDPALAAPLVGLLTFWAAHTLVYMDLMYYYVKLPFVFLFAFSFVGWLLERPANRAGRSFLWGLTLATLVLTAAVLWPR
jgi:hypothetical protein